MASAACPGCRARDARIAELEALVRDLTARLGINSSNSSVPPSANPRNAPKPVVKKPTGGQPGHPPHLKQLLPPERVKEVIPFLPSHCRQTARQPTGATPARRARPPL